MSGLVQQYPGAVPASVLFLVLTINAAFNGSIAAVQSTLSGIEDLAKTVAFRGPPNGFSVNVGIGSDAWDSVTGAPRPRELHTFQEIKGPVHTAVSTPGDLLFHVKAARHDLVYEFEKLLLADLGESVFIEDTAYAFPYFDGRNLQEFVDGTANPVNGALNQAVFATKEDGTAAENGTYVITQRYNIDLVSWNTKSTEDQEAVFGRKKPNNVELPDVGPDEQKSHRQLNTIIVNGTQYEIFRDALPFATPTLDKKGTYFIAHSHLFWVIEKMLNNMFIGDPVGKYDRLLDFATPVTGTAWFMPSLAFLQGLGN